MIDVILKDEGDFFTMYFQTEKAKKIIANENVVELSDKGTLKLDIAIVSKPKIVSWLISHALSWENF